MNRRYLKYIKPGDEVLWKDKVQELTGRHVVKEIHYVEYLERVVIVTDEDVRLEGSMKQLHLGSEATLDDVQFRKAIEDAHAKAEYADRLEREAHERAMLKAATQAERDRLVALKKKFDLQMAEFDKAEAHLEIENRKMARKLWEEQKAKEKKAAEAREEIEFRRKMKTTYDVDTLREVLGAEANGVMRHAYVDTGAAYQTGTCAVCGVEGYMVKWKKGLYCRDCLCADSPDMEKQQLISSNFGRTVDFSVPHPGHGHFHGMNSRWLLDRHVWAEHILHSLPYTYSAKAFYLLREELVAWSNIHQRNEWKNARSMLSVRFQAGEVAGVKMKYRGRGGEAAYRPL